MFTHTWQAGYHVTYRADTEEDIPTRETTRRDVATCLLSLYNCTAMANTDAILTELQYINKRLDGLAHGQARLETTIEVLQAGQDDIREKLETKADKADILDVGAKLDKYQKRNERRFENLEEVTETHNPHKN